MEFIIPLSLDNHRKMHTFNGMTPKVNQYERALQNWLSDNAIQHLAVDQQKRKLFARNKIKSFDFLVYPHCVDINGSVKPNLLITEVKGRLFKGATLAANSSLPNWVTKEDIRGLMQWEQVFAQPSSRQSSLAVFVFAYKFAKIDVETDGHETYDFDDSKFFFYAVTLDDYRKYMKLRSQKWQTVNLPAADFRKVAVPLRDLLL